jgi:serine/threonine-protein kinase RsbW
VTKKKTKYFLRLESKSSNLNIIREFVSRIAFEAGFSVEEVNKIELAVDEASSNVVEHAYPDNLRNIEIEVSYDPKSFQVKVKDKGVGFQPEEIKVLDMKKYLERYEVGGLGIRLMKSLMDQVEYDINPGKRNQVVLTKYRT